MLVLAIIIVAIIIIANNTAGGFVQRDNERRRLESQKNYDELIRTRKENEDLKNQNSQLLKDVLDAEMVRRRQSPDYITDAEIIEDNPKQIE